MTEAATIEKLDPRRAADVDGVARLHETYLADSPVVRLGPRFVRELYYRRLPTDGLLDCLVCRFGGRVVGFLAYTTQPAQFLGEGLRRHFFSIAWIMVASLLASPGRLGDLWFSWRLMRERRESPPPGAGPRGEALSMAVVPECEKLIPAGGVTRVSRRLFDMMAADLRQRGVESILFRVQPGNRAANLFYSGLGCRLEKVVHAGVVIHRYTYSLRASEGRLGEESRNRDAVR
jgi:hypothetical protein